MDNLNYDPNQLQMELAKLTGKIPEDKKSNIMEILVPLAMLAGGSYATYKMLPSVLNHIDDGANKMTASDISKLIQESKSSIGYNVDKFTTGVNNKFKDLI